jgi:hypothetical protein
MNRDQLEHALRSACGIAGERDILVIGSQSILASFPEHMLPAEATRSLEVDIGFFNDPDGHKADLVEGRCGEDSDYSRMFGFAIDGVDLGTATLPDGWWDRLVDVENANTGGARGLCLEPHDCAVSKLVANRDKDRRFVAALLGAGLIYVDVLAERVGQTDVPEAVRQRIRVWLATWQ